ncbi:hypothetical protein AAJCM20276_05170 [Acetobacter aceti]|uniref:Transposase n=1 Tax=Acetobacter aceti TaxID=435 RepID=A0A6S6PF50_ACEAC|nr:hypothetical protein AAJCM20276_05170 [Acetobacter aceti]
MTRALSADLRRRAIAAVASGMTRRAAAVRFGVSASSVIRWVAEWQASGREHALKQGGDRRSHRIEAWSTFLLAEIETKADISLVETGGETCGGTRCPLCAEHDLAVPQPSRHDRQKNGARQRADTARRRTAARGLV